ncbi:LLM class flavin-dependent oxidoreductase [Naumannella huperziae]
MNDLNATGSPARGPLLGLTLDGFGTHPEAWRATPGDPRRVWRADFALDLVQRAEAAGIDFVLFGDENRTDASRGRLDPIVLAARIAPVTTAIGLVAETAVSHREPFHVAKALATLDHISRGRAGWSVQVDTSAAGAARVGHRPAPTAAEAGREAREVVEVVRALWDSWEDDAVIRDRPTGRFVDRDKLHYVDFTGEFFTVRGPLITPRPPQGNPPVLVRSGVPDPAAELADVVTGDTGPAGAPRLAELEVTVDVRGSRARARAAELAAASADEAAPADRPRFVGSAADLATRIGELAGDFDGVLLRPAVTALDVPVITGVVVPDLIERGVLHRTAPDRLRNRFGLPAAANRYAA